MLPGIVQHSSSVSRAFVLLCIIEDESSRVVLLGRNVMVASRISRTQRGRGCWRVTAGMTFNWRGLQVPLLKLVCGPSRPRALVDNLAPVVAPYADSSVQLFHRPHCCARLLDKPIFHSPNVAGLCCGYFFTYPLFTHSCCLFSSCIIRNIRKLSVFTGKIPL